MYKNFLKEHHHVIVFDVLMAVSSIEAEEAPAFS